MTLKRGDLRHTAWGQLVRAMYTVQMHGGRGFDVEGATLRAVAAANELLPDGETVSRVTSIASESFVDGVGVVVRLRNGAVAHRWADSLDMTVDVGDLVRYRVVNGEVELLAVVPE